MMASSLACITILWLLCVLAVNCEDRHSGLYKGGATMMTAVPPYNLTSKRKEETTMEIQNSLNCYHLIQNLDDVYGYMFLSPTKYIIKDYHVEGLFEEIVPSDVQRQLDLYHDQELCSDLQLASKEENLICLNAFGRDQSNSTDYDGFNFRYFLKRRCDRGSFGEVWLAVRKNCYQNGDKFNLLRNEEKGNVGNSFNNDHGKSTKYSSTGHSSDSHSGLKNDETFILKRIMVEEGNDVYLSGLREKHFGELFLNASISRGGSQRKFPLKPFTKFNASFNAAAIRGWMNNSFKFDREPLGTFGEDFHESIMQEKGVEDEEGLKHIARYIESFETQTKEFWLVFRNEGQSLSKMIYTAKPAQNFEVLQPSSWWSWLRRTEEGNDVMRSLIKQLIWAVKVCHDLNITHRDIKPDRGSGDCLRGFSGRIWPNNITMRIIDFGSAIDQFTIEHLYGANGPSRAEQTLEYAPPEAFLPSKWFHGCPQEALKYDMWSIGVVMLELILGTPHAFEISARTRVLVGQRLKGWSEFVKELAYRLRALQEMCILLPGSSPHHAYRSRGSTSYQTEASWECSEEAFAEQIKKQDPLKLGFPNIWALRLVRQLLQWHPEDRISANEALQHPYFNLKHES